MIPRFCLSLDTTEAEIFEDRLHSLLLRRILVLALGWRGRSASFLLFLNAIVKDLDVAHGVDILLLSLLLIDDLNLRRLRVGIITPVSFATASFLVRQLILNEEVLLAVTYIRGDHELAVLDLLEADHVVVSGPLFSGRLLTLVIEVFGSLANLVHELLRVAWHA